MPTLGEINLSILQDWKVPEEYRAYLNKYYVLKWDREYFEQQKAHGMIEHCGVKYSIVFEPHTDLVKLMRCRNVWLSFRKFSFQTYGIVMVSHGEVKQESRSLRNPNKRV